jgi:hypothetical protein
MAFLLTDAIAKALNDGSRKKHKARIDFSAIAWGPLDFTVNLRRRTLTLNRARFPSDIAALIAFRTSVLIDTAFLTDDQANALISSLAVGYYGSKERVNRS